MTEEEFLTLTQSQDAAAQFSSRSSPLRTTTRKARLFVCACCRRVWGHLSDAGRAAVEAAERAADGLIRIKDLRAYCVASPRELKVGGRRVRNPANYAAAPFVWVNAGPAAGAAAYLFGLSSSDVAAGRRSAEEQEWLAQCGLLREALGNPFRPLSLSPEHRTPTVVSLARTAYDERCLPSGSLDLHRLAVLADVLEETGATGDLVSHLRSPGPHVRGCFAVDLCLGLS